MAIPAQCPACGRFLSRTFVRRAAEAPSPCPKCERALVAESAGDVHVVLLADRDDVPDGVGAPSIAALPEVEPEPADPALVEQAEVYAAGLEEEGDGDVVAVDEVAAAVGSDERDDLAAGAAEAGPADGDDEATTDEPRDEVASVDGDADEASTDGPSDEAAAHGDVAADDSPASAGEEPAMDDRGPDPTSGTAVEAAGADATPADLGPVPGGVDDGSVDDILDLTDHSLEGDDGSLDDGFDVDEDDTAEVDLVGDEPVIDLTGNEPAKGADHDPLAGWDADTPSNAAELPRQGTEALALVASAITAGIVLGAFSGRRRLLRSVIGALVGALGALGVRRAGEGRDLRRP